jgi:hypothetical protein
VRLKLMAAENLLGLFDGLFNRPGKMHTKLQFLSMLQAPQGR